MKNIALFTITILFIFGFAGSLPAYEGGTKVIATMTHPERGESPSSPLILVPHNDLTAGKPFLAFLHRVPRPTLSAARIREEKAGPSLGTKSLIRFQKTSRV